MKVKPLNDLEMHELLRLIYPEHIQSDEDHHFELSADIAENCMVDLGDGFEVPLAALLARVCMLTMPMKSDLSETYAHCLGEIRIRGGNAHMLAAVRRKSELPGLDIDHAQQ